MSSGAPEFMTAREVGVVPSFRAAFSGSSSASFEVTGTAAGSLVVDAKAGAWCQLKSYRVHIGRALHWNFGDTPGCGPGRP